MVAIVRLVFARDSLLLGVGWANDTLTYTAPEIGNLVSPCFFAPLRDGRWAGYDWRTGSARYLRFETRPGAGFPDAVTLETSNGSIRFSRR